MLPTLRLPILLVHRVLVCWLANSKAPKVDNIAKVLGISGAIGGCAQRLARRLPVAESECAVKNKNKES